MFKVIWQKAALPTCHPMHSFLGTLQWAGTCPHQKCPFPWEDLDPILRPTRVSPKRHLDRLFPTHRDTDHATCDICINRPSLCTACRLCGLKCNACILLLLLLQSLLSNLYGGRLVMSQHSSNELLPVMTTASQINTDNGIIINTIELNLWQINLI